MTMQQQMHMLHKQRRDIYKRCAICCSAVRTGKQHDMHESRLEDRGMWWEGTTCTINFWAFHGQYSPGASLCILVTQLFEAHLHAAKSIVLRGKTFVSYQAQRCIIGMQITVKNNGKTEELNQDLDLEATSDLEQAESDIREVSSLLLYQYHQNQSPRQITFCKTLNDDGLSRSNYLPSRSEQKEKGELREYCCRARACDLHNLASVEFKYIAETGGPSEGFAVTMCVMISIIADPTFLQTVDEIIARMQNFLEVSRFTSMKPSISESKHKTHGPKTKSQNDEATYKSGENFEMLAETDVWRARQRLVKIATKVQIILTLLRYSLMQILKQCLHPTLSLCRATCLQHDTPNSEMIVWTSIECVIWPWLRAALPLNGTASGSSS